MFKAIVTYLVGRKIVSFIVMATMMVVLLTTCLIAYAFVPEASEDSDISTSYSSSVVSETNNANSIESRLSFPADTAAVNSAA